MVPTAWACAGFMVVLGGLWMRLAIVAGGSMEPALARGDICVVVSGLAVEPGDIVLYADGASLVLHRVHRLSESGDLWTKGDANSTRDRSPVPLDQVRGRVIFTIPLGSVSRGWMPSAHGAKLQNQSHSMAMTERRSGTSVAGQGEAP